MEAPKCCTELRVVIADGTFSRKTPPFQNDIEAPKKDKLKEETPTSVIIPVYRKNSHQEVIIGSHRYPGRGTYLLKFDNSYSFFRTKIVYYRCFYGQWSQWQTSLATSSKIRAKTLFDSFFFGWLRTRSCGAKRINQNAKSRHCFESSDACGAPTIWSLVFDTCSREFALLERLRSFTCGEFHPALGRSSTHIYYTSRFTSTLDLYMNVSEAIGPH